MEHWLPTGQSQNAWRNTMSVVDCLRYMASRLLELMEIVQGQPAWARVVPPHLREASAKRLQLKKCIRSDYIRQGSAAIHRRVWDGGGRVGLTISRRRGRMGLDGDLAARFSDPCR